MTGKKRLEKEKCKYAEGDYKCSRIALPGDKHCIFHSTDIEGKNDKFNERLCKEFNRQKKRDKEYDFTGFVFPGEILFERKTFEKDVSFFLARFSGEANFSFAQFSGEANFRFAQFSGEANFRGAKFNRNGHFQDVQFFEMAYFDRAEFYTGNDNLDGAIDGSVTPVTQIPVKGSAKKYWVGMKIIVGTNDNSGNGFEITAVNVATNTITISPGVNDAQIDATVVRGLIPAVKNSTANFSHTKFSKFAGFSEAQFGGEVHFTGTEFFEYANFNLFRFRGKVTFREVKFHKRADFQNIIADEDVNNLSFEYTYLFNVRGLFEFIEENEKVFEKLRKRSSTLKTEFLPDNFRLILGEDTAARYPVISRQIRDDMYLLDKKERNSKKRGIKKCLDNTLYFLWWLSADYGRSFFQWALWSLIIAEIFAVTFGIFYCFNPLSFKSEVISFSWPGISFLYYSIVTFTTLGFGDIVPKIPGLQIIIMIEVVLGYIMLGGLISIFANKLARRS
jgi:uncharacterized protein YjbI with pentapeptide repeats